LLDYSVNLQSNQKNSYMSTTSAGSSNENVKIFGTAPVFFTAISTILGAILFLRFGYAVGTLGFFGVFLIIILGHLITIPTALSISEIATNQKVEGGGEYFFMSRSFGLNIGATIGIALFLSQAISVAFYVIAFAEAFDMFFVWYENNYGMALPRQAVSLPAMAILAGLILTKGANLGVKTLYVVVALLFVSLVMFFAGSSTGSAIPINDLFSDYTNRDQFFLVFAIIFPAFTGMTAGVGLSGDLKNPGKSIPMGTIFATITGLIVYMFVILKLTMSATPEELLGDQLIMSKIAIGGIWLIPMGLAASTISSALGSVMVAPRTLQALAIDQSFPLEALNKYLSKGVGKTNEPRNASIIVVIFATVFILLGDVDIVAQIISMFFMVTYGSLNLISFLNHFGADPSYRPRFKSRWYLSLPGFVLSFWMMFQMSVGYALIAIGIMVIIYLYIHHYHKNRNGMEALFRGVFFQLNRKLQVYLQKSKKSLSGDSWRPSAICVSEDSFVRDDAFKLLSWISHNHGFGTYIHLIQGYYSKSTYQEAEKILSELIEKSENINSNVYLDTIISPSYTSAIAQIIQLPGISGMENNMVIFEFDKESPTNLSQITDNFNLVRAGNYDVCILGSSRRTIDFGGGIHVWIRSSDAENANLMILLSFIILGHPDWQKSHIKMFAVCKENEISKVETDLTKLVETGRLPIARKNIEIIIHDENISSKERINQKSHLAGLTVMGFRSEQLKHAGNELFTGYNELGNLLFVNAHKEKEIK
jgi:amino acid transporter